MLLLCTDANSNAHLPSPISTKEKGRVPQATSLQHKQIFWCLNNKSLLLYTDASSKANLPSPHKQEGERECALSYFPTTQTNILKLEQRMLAAVHCGQQLGIHSLSSYAVRIKGGYLKLLPKRQTNVLILEQQMHADLVCCKQIGKSFLSSISSRKTRSVVLFSVS